MTCSTIQADSGLFTLGSKYIQEMLNLHMRISLIQLANLSVAVAPGEQFIMCQEVRYWLKIAIVTDWLYYDSVYTERYMSTPSANPQGYFETAIHNVTAFGKVDFLLAHGSGDDNVHFMHSASLLDKLTQQHVEGWRFRMFTDSSV